MASDEIKEWWENHSEDFQEEYKVEVDINYGPGSPNEDSLNLLGDIKGKDILEIGCGGAQCGIALAKKGANVTGIDISEEQLDYAKELTRKNNVEIKFHQGNIESLDQIESKSQDIVFSSWALLYIEDLEKCFKEVNRVLRDGGIFVFSLNHPFWINIDKENMKIKRSYFDIGFYSNIKYNAKWSAYHYKISDFINALITSGLTIDKVIEPDSSKIYKEDFWYERYGEHHKKTMKFIPRTIIFKARN